MAFTVDENGNITLVQGDSGTLVIEGLNTDKDYTVYFAIQDKNRKFIGEELHVQTNNNEAVVFELTGDYTELLKVPQNQSVEVYYYGVKLCTADGFEETLLLGNSEIGDINTITVYPKKVEGI